MNDVYFKASLQNTLNPEVGTFDNVNSKEGIFTLEDGEYYLTNNTSNSYRVYYPTKDIYSVGFTIEFDVNYNSNSGFKWLLLFNGDDSTYWHGFSLESSILRYVGKGLSDYDLITSTNTWLHVKCIFDYYFNQNAVHIYIDNVEVNNFIISNNYGIKYIDILGNSAGYVADAKIKNIIIYNSSKKHYLDTIGLTSLWSKIKSLFATKTELGSKANDADVVHKSGDETVNGVKTFASNMVIQGGKKVVCNVDNSFLELNGGTTWGKGGSIVLSGQNRPSNTNSVLIVSKNDTNTFIIEYQNGTLTPIQGDNYLGTSTNKWKTLNGIDPGALSLPSNNRIDILSTLQLDGYTAPSNGYVRAIKNVKTECASTFGIRNETTGIEDRRIAERLFVIGVMVPVKTGEKVIISDDWNSISNVNVTYSAFFCPCSGNV